MGGVQLEKWNYFHFMSWCVTKAIGQMFGLFIIVTFGLASKTYYSSGL